MSMWVSVLHVLPGARGIMLPLTDSAWRERNVLEVIVSGSLALPGCTMGLTLVVRVTEAMIGAEAYCTIADILANT